MVYFYPNFQKEVYVEEISYLDIPSLSFEQKQELAKFYANTFNSDNKFLIKKLKISGKSVPEGLWDEDPYTLEKALSLIEEYSKPIYQTIAAFNNQNKNEILGAFILQKRDKNHFDSRNYLAPFQIPEDAEYWDEIDILRRDFFYKKEKIKNFTNMMREEILKKIVSNNKILLYSSTNNPNMVKSWQNNGFSVIERNTTFGNKFQAFKLIEGLVKQAPLE